MAALAQEWSPLIPATISEEEGWKVIAYERSFCEKYKK